MDLLLKIITIIYSIIPYRVASRETTRQAARFVISEISVAAIAKETIVSKTPVGMEIYLKSVRISSIVRLPDIITAPKFIKEV